MQEFFRYIHIILLYFSLVNLASPGAGYENQTRTSCLGSKRTITILIPLKDYLSCYFLFSEYLEPPWGFEPQTPALRKRCSSQLS
jgi:hypothetical protein